MNNMTDISYWLDQIVELPCVTGWQWTEEQKKKWESLFQKENIPACFDQHNLLLGATSPHEWQTKLKTKPLLFRACMNHPGGLVVNTLYQSTKRSRYVAISSYPHPASTQGGRFLVKTPDGATLDSVVIDWDIQGYRDHFITFKSSVSLPYGSLLVPCPAIPDTLNNKLVHWGLSHHIVCAVLIALFKNMSSQMVLGKITLDTWPKNEAGINHFDLVTWPEDKKNTLLCGQGSHIVKSNNATQLGIACKHHHNAAVHEEWRPEECFCSDVASLSQNLFSLVTNHNKPSCPKQFPPVSKFVVNDLVSMLLKQGEPPLGYTEAMTTTIKKWNELHEKNNLNAITMTAHQWPFFRKELLTCGCIVRDILPEIPKLFDAIITSCPLFRDEEPIKIHLLAHAKIENLSTPHNVFVSTETLPDKNWQAFMVFVITTSLCETRLISLSQRPIIKHFLAGGFGLWLAKQFYPSSSLSLILGIQEDQSVDHQRNTDSLLSRFNDFVFGSFWEVSTNRHENLTLKNIENPFSSNSQAPYYGYLLGFNCISDYMQYNDITSLLSDEGLQFAYNYLSNSLSNKIIP